MLGKLDFERFYGHDPTVCGGDCYHCLGSYLLDGVVMEAGAHCLRQAVCVLGKGKLRRNLDLRPEVGLDKCRKDAGHVLECGL